MHIQYKPINEKIKVLLPGSKSISNRLLIIAAVGNFYPGFKNLSQCDDVKVLNDALHANSNRFDLKDSGTALRFLTAFMSGIVGKWHLTGSERLRQRPVKPLVDALQSTGAQIVYDKNTGFAPLTITGTKMKGGEIKVDINESSQYASALLLIAPMFLNGLKLKLQGNRRSVPYIELTIKIMQEFGIKIMQYDDEIDILPGQEYTPAAYAVEPDWSAAAFWYELAAINPKMQIKFPRLVKTSFQGDKDVAKFFEKLGVTTRYGAQHTSIQRKEKINSNFFKADISQTPDLFPALALTCMAQQRPFEITGTANLAIKESNRIDAVKNIADTMNITLYIGEDSVKVENYDQKLPQSCSFSTHGDHRIAMAIAPLAAVIPEIEIDEPEVVSKSYPAFWDDMKRAGIVLT